MTQPSRLAFWRSALLLTTVLPFLAIRDLLHLAQELDVDVLASKSWMGVLAILGAGGLTALLALVSTWFRAREQTLSLLELPTRIRWLGFFFIILSLIGYTFVFSIPISRNLLSDLDWVRFLVFWIFSLIGMYGFRAIKENLPWLISLLVVVLFQTALHLLATKSGVSKRATTRC